MLVLDSISPLCVYVCVRMRVWVCMCAHACVCVSFIYQLLSAVMLITNRLNQLESPMFAPCEGDNFALNVATNP